MAEEARIPPQNIEAEMSVLGSLMLDKDAILKVVDIIAPHNFYRDRHRAISEAMIDLFERREPIDVLSVSNRLREKGVLEEVGGMSYLTSLVNAVPTATNVVHYAEIVHRKHLLRNLIDVSQQIGQLGYQESGDVETLLDEAERKVFGIAQRSLRQRFASVAEALEGAWERIDTLQKGDTLRGLSTGFTQLDNLLAGLQKSDFIVLASRPSFGKTTLALDIVRHAAIKNNIPVGIFSLEMSTAQLVDRLIAAEAHVDLWKLRTGRLSTESDEFLRIRDTLDRLSKAPIFIDDEATNTILQMRAMARRLQAEHGLGLIVIDYLQLINWHKAADSLVQQVTEISRALKALARELDIPVLTLSQLSRAVEQRHPPIPKLSDLRESGSIEQDADVVMFIYREDRYKEDSPNKNITEIIIAKHRNGPLGKATLFFNQDKVCFTNLDKTGENAYGLS